MNEILARLARHGLWIVFGNVFLEQVGAPLPALPTLIVSGALAANGRLPLLPLLGAALAGSILADTVWFLIGRWQGHRVLRLVCRISLSPDSCVRRTEDLFERRGMLSLLFAKFVPGYNTVAPPLAGAMGTSLAAFVFWDGLGGLLWIGLAVALGWAFHGAVDRALVWLQTLGLWAALVVGIVLALVIAYKVWERRRLRRVLDQARITVHELRELMDRGAAPVIVDVRTERAHQGGHIPGALRIALEELDDRLHHLPRDREVVLYCT
jgi:membrane protein DedA with SNARE-associated domain